MIQESELLKLRDEYFPESTNYLNYKKLESHNGYYFYIIRKYINTYLASKEWCENLESLKYKVKYTATFSTNEEAQFFIDLFLY